jgi:hypothetical protein
MRKFNNCKIKAPNGLAALKPAPGRTMRHSPRVRPSAENQARRPARGSPRAPASGVTTWCRGDLPYARPPGRRECHSICPTRSAERSAQGRRFPCPLIRRVELQSPARRVSPKASPAIARTTNNTGPIEVTCQRRSTLPGSRHHWAMDASTLSLSNFQSRSNMGMD